MGREAIGVPGEAGTDRNVEAPLEEWRRHILMQVLRWGSLCLILPWALGTWAALDADLSLLAAVTMAGYLLLLAIAFLPRLPFGVRAMGLLGLCWGIGLSVISQVGPLGAGTLWLASVPVLATFLYGLKGAGWGLAVVGATVLALSFPAASPAGLGPPEGVPPDIRYDLTSWLANVGSVMGLAALLAIPFAILLRRSEGAIRQERQVRAELEAEARRREELEARLRQSERLEALGTFAGGIAHDFNNLLVPILGEAEEIERRMPKESPEAEGARGIIASATRARDLVRSILSFSRIGPDDRADPGIRADPSQLLKELTPQLHRRLPDGVTLVTEDASGGLLVTASPLEIHQILMNLATNGIMAMEEAGGELRIGLHRRRDELRIRVLDSGHGMSPETLSRVFDPFFTTRPVGRGTGLGLSTVHGIVTRLGGRIEIDSTPGRGTKVEVLLPEASGDPVPEKTAAEGELPQVDRAAPLIVVDDDPVVLATTARALRRLGYHAIEAPDGGAALDLLEELSRQGKAIPLVLTDKAMPVMDGLELAREVRRRHPSTEVVLVTGNVDGPGIEALSPGSGDSPLAAVLAKPFRLQELEAVVRRVLSRRAL
jgi:signal transduction histidine kinase/CheY-like chemotaxis protein